jgi:chemotaxis protein histidine kinase CheA
MADSKHDTPGVTKFADHEVIVPPNRLKKALKRASADDYDPLIAAEEAFEELSTQFAAWMEDECTGLDEARRVIHAQGFTDITRETLFRAAHDIKGHGSTFGFPLAADAADSLCRVLEHTTDLGLVPLKFVDQCVDAVRAIIREHGNVNAEETAFELVKGLRALADELVGSAGLTDAPAETSPPLAPA